MMIVYSLCTCAGFVICHVMVRVCCCCHSLPQGLNVCVRVCIHTCIPVHVRMCICKYEGIGVYVRKQRERERERERDDRSVSVWFMRTSASTDLASRASTARRPCLKMRRFSSCCRVHSAYFVFVLFGFGGRDRTRDGMGQGAGSARAAACTRPGMFWCARF